MFVFALITVVTYGYPYDPGDQRCVWSELITDVALQALCTDASASGTEEVLFAIEVKKEYLLDNELSGRNKRATKRALTYDSILSSYIEWRNQKGYGRTVGRWGRDLSHVQKEQQKPEMMTESIMENNEKEDEEDDVNTIDFENLLKSLLVLENTSNSSTQKKTDHNRVRRETDSSKGRMSPKLLKYRNWREHYGYEKRAKKKKKKRKNMVKLI